MRSELQIQASRANGSKSRGPITEEGKLASSRNAEKHGLLSTFVVLSGEDQCHFQKLIERLYEELQPQSGIEEDLVETMAVARWRQTRLWIVEKSSYDRQILREMEQARPNVPHPSALCGMAFATLGNDSRTLDLINRYESRFDRQYLRAHKRLMDMRKSRESNPPNEPKPEPAVAARDTAPPDASRGVIPFTPPANSFIPRPNRHLSRKQRRKQRALSDI